ncbi:uncharacterized protein LOC108026550 [Drosophila biarmipes]|uniref:uncharacterized protein LOC108026550 n=1 Tax=Drosophila biarmipes TaxID=125945 RepID=UPI0007E78DCC|nr:uncharacterized protein LOC108026550 [Drosophila biarmipes]
MLPSVKENVPELLLEPARLAFCANLHLGRQQDRFNFETTLVLARNLKFYEFRRKELVHHIDLRDTKLQQVRSQLEGYDGPVSPFLITTNARESLDSSMLQDPDELPIKFGKYVFQREGIYLLIHCWQHLVVLRRPKEHGANFELVAQHNGVLSYQMAEGPIPYQAVVELRFANGERELCDFQEPAEEGEEEEQPSTSKEAYALSEDMEARLQEVNALRAELSSQRMKTHEELALLQDLQLFGPPGERSLLLEEKQPLRRLGDVWTRVCGDYLVCGTVLVNISGSHRLIIVNELYPTVFLEPHIDFCMEHRLYELPLLPNGQPPEEIDQLAQFWACQNQHTRRLNWRAVPNARQVPPESSVAIVVRLRLVDLLQAEQLQLIVHYEVGVSADKKAFPRQLHLIDFDVKKLLDATESMAPTFSPTTLHQDFLAVIMTHEEHCALKLVFQDAKDCKKFEQQLVSKLQFEVLEAQEPEREQESDLLDDSSPGSPFQSSTGAAAAAANPVQRIFYNRKPTSQWCGTLLLRDDPGEQWHVYALTEDRMRLFMHRLMRDLLLLHCNLTYLGVNEPSLSVADANLELEKSLQEELEAWKLLLKPAASEEERRKQLTHLYKVQMASDVLASMIISKTEPDKEKLSKMTIGYTEDLKETTAC